MTNNTNIVRFQEQKNDLDYFKSLAAVAVKSGNYTGMTEATLLNLMLSAKDLGVSPMKAINGGFYVVNGKVCMSTALMADRIRKAGHSVKITEWNEEKCTIIGIRKDNNDSVKLDFTMKDAERAGLLKSPTWQKWPKNMLYNRAMSTLARVLFSDVVGNAYSEEERFDIQNVPAEKRPEEEMSEEITIEHPTPSMDDEMLSDEQIGEINTFCEKHPDFKHKFFSWMKVVSANGLPASAFQKFLKAKEKFCVSEGIAV
jgi:hypothetical protein